MQKSYLVKQPMNFGQVLNFFIKPGDILIFNSANQNKVTVYRDGNIMKIIPNQSLVGLSGLVKIRWIEEIAPEVAKAAVEAPKPPIPVPQPPVQPVEPPPAPKVAAPVVEAPEAPKPQSKPAEKPAAPAPKPKPKPEVKPEPKPEPKPLTTEEFTDKVEE